MMKVTFEQQEIVRRVEGLFALADQLEERLAQARGQVDQLTPSLLARAFAGKLVPKMLPTNQHRNCWDASGGQTKSEHHAEAFFLHDTG